MDSAIRCIVRIKITKDILKSPQVMLDDLGVPIGGLVVAEGGVEYPTLSGFLTPVSGIFALQIERDIGGFGFARFAFRFRRDCFDFTVVVMCVFSR